MSYSFKGNGIYTQVFPIRFLRLYARWMISWNFMFSFLGHTLFLFSLHFKSCILIYQEAFYKPGKSLPSINTDDNANEIARTIIAILLHYLPIMM